MSQRNRIFIGLALLVVIAGVVAVVEMSRRSAEVEPGSIPIYVGDRVRARFVPDDLGELDQVSFVDDEEGKTQEGWLLRDVLRLYVEPPAPDAGIIVSSSSREKSVTLTWAQVDDVENMVMFDLSGRGTLKLVSRGVDQLDVRDEWVQDVDRIEIEP